MIKLANRYLFNYKKLLAIVTIVSIFSSATEIVLPYYLSRFIDDVLIKKDISCLVTFTIILSVIAILEVCFNYFSNISFAKLQSKSIFDFNTDLIKKTQKLPLSFFQEHTASYLTQRINQDAYSVISFLLRNYINVICNTFLLFLIMYLLVQINAVLFLIFFISA